MFVTNWISTTKIQKISEITNFLGTISYPELRSKLHSFSYLSKPLHQTTEIAIRTAYFIHVNR